MKQQNINNRAALITNWASLSHNWHQILYLFLEGYNCHFITEVFGWNWLICYFITSAYKMCIDRICNIIWKLDKYIFNLLLLIYCFWCVPLWIISLLISNQYDNKNASVICHDSRFIKQDKLNCLLLWKVWALLNICNPVTWCMCTNHVSSW